MRTFRSRISTGDACGVCFQRWSSHWPLLSFLNILSAGPPPVALRWIALGSSFLLAWLTYRYIEVPIRRRKDWKFNLRLAASAVAAGIAGVIIYAAGGVSQRFDADIQALRQGPRRDELCYARFGDTAPINYCRTTSAQAPSIRHGATAAESKEAIFEYGVRSLLSELTESSRVIYLGEMPAFSTAPSCFLRAVRLPTTQCHPERDRGQVELAMAPYNRVLERVQLAFPQIQLVDTIAVLCAANVCSQRPPGKPILYSDAVHLSPAGARILVENTRLTHLISRNMLSAESG
jgi:hypothetical protein